MRHLFFCTALAAVVIFSGCQSCSTLPTPIVGDSMCQWGATTNSSEPCQPETVDFRGALAKLFAGGGSCGPSCGSGKYNDFDNSLCGPAGCGCDSQYGGNCRMTYGNAMSPCGVGGCQAGPAMMPVNPMPMRFAPPTATMQPNIGCGGTSCAGICGGRCGVARVMAAAHMRHAAMNHPVANMIQSSHRACAYGACGARPGPEQGAVSFPYYSVRGPRDFLAGDPPSIGP